MGDMGDESDEEMFEDMEEVEASRAVVKPGYRKLMDVAVSYGSRVTGMLREPETILLVVVVEQVWVESTGALGLIW